jgi:DNA-binding MurR/RpiR family transcriptional regulator
MTAEVKTKIVEEVKRFASDLNLSESQKAQMHTAFEKAEGRLEQIRKENPDVTRADVVKKLVGARDQIREHVVKFLTPEQLTKWDAAIAKAREFLGHPMQV